MYLYIYHIYILLSYSCPLVRLGFLTSDMFGINCVIDHPPTEQSHSSKKRNDKAREPHASCV